VNADQRLGYFNGQWRPLTDIALPLDDWGTLQGATLVERLRTVNGQPLDAAGHLARLQASCRVLNIDWPSCLDDASLIHECIDRNRELHAHPDFSIVILLTPGRAQPHPPGSHPTLILHSTDLAWSALSHWYQQGQALIVASNRNVPSTAWPTFIKSRSRLHYFLADRQAAASQQPFTGAILLDQHDCVTESSVANLLVVEEGGLISPPLDAVLHGLSLQRTVRLASSLGIPVRYEPIPLARALAAQALLLTGSSGCIWPARSLEDVEFPDASAHPVFQRLASAWTADMGLDFLAQAHQQTVLRFA
jgi:branched-chain amino acid aminotransferase